MKTVSLNNLLVAAEVMIARIWKPDETPTIYDWQVFCQDLFLMHKLMAIEKAGNGSEIALISFFAVWSKLLITGTQGNLCIILYKGRGIATTLMNCLHSVYMLSLIHCIYYI